MLLKVCAVCVGLGAFLPVFATTDYVFDSSYENLVCNGVGCAYCSPTNSSLLCGSDSHCSPQADSTSICTYPAGAGTSNAACSAIADCASPYACVNNGVSTTCQKWCAYPGVACPGAQTCSAFNPPMLIGSSEWGVCL